MIAFIKGKPVWADTGKPVKTTVNYCTQHKLGIEHAEPKKEMDARVMAYEKELSFDAIARGMKINRIELYSLIKSLPMDTNEMLRTDDVARVLNIPPGTLAGKCRAAGKKII